MKAEKPPDLPSACLHRPEPQPCSLGLLRQLFLPAISSLQTLPAIHSTPQSLQSPTSTCPPCIVSWLSPGTSDVANSPNLLRFLCFLSPEMTSLSSQLPPNSGFTFVFSHSFTSPSLIQTVTNNDIFLGHLVDRRHCSKQLVSYYFIILFNPAALPKWYRFSLSPFYCGGNRSQESVNEPQITCL